MARTKEFEITDALDAAVETFWQRGYAQTSMQNLVDAMAIGRRSIYDTFGDKRALFAQALTRYFATTDALFSANLVGAPTIVDQLRIIFTTAFTPRDNHPRGCLLVNSATELALTEPTIAAQVQDLFAQERQRLVILLERAQTAGDLAAATNIPALASYIHNALVGVRVLAKTTTDTNEFTAVLDLTLSAVH